jgi:hypothetical protein
VALGSLVILVMYALFPEAFRYSRALIVLGSAWALTAVYVIRALFNLLPGQILSMELRAREKRLLLIGYLVEAIRVKELIMQTNIRATIVGIVSPDIESQSGYLGNIQQLDEIIRINKINEIVFCSKDVAAKDIIAYMLKLTDPAIEFKIASPESISIIGSSSINTAGELYTIEFNSLSKSVNKRKKRLLDVVVSLLMLIALPVVLFRVRNVAGLLRNMVMVTTGFRSWVGLYPTALNQNIVPDVKKGILTPLDVQRNKPTHADSIEKLNLMYAKDYKVLNDISIILRSLKHVGRKS